VFQRNPVYLKDYTPPPYRAETVQLRFELDEQNTEVTATVRYRAEQPGEPLHLAGQGLTLLAIHLDGRPLAPAEYTTTEEQLTLHQPPAQFELTLVTRIHPKENTALAGLYLSGGNFCTQCEAEGFRRITYYPDRPDVMAQFTTTLVAEQARYPVLLANGNCVEQGTLPDGRHFATWHDPFPKPSYLFALVAGDLACQEGHFTTRSGREVVLRIYVRAHDLEKCDHAMASLQRAMAWDEESYGREYDLDIYMIVAVSDFNMGAMENKGLNIFNSSYVLASPATATDIDFVNIEGVIGHEYFHNWSGNRITCRDWFQLSLKEGFTVFRDEQFTADMNSAALKRIEDVRLLRTHQFREDGGPMAHPVRPDSYVEINNFYTLTVYNKGAEVVRMLHTLLGPAGFRRGTDLYFERYDGQAVTTDDFVQALEEANGVDLTQFRRWYSQAGTPQIQIERQFDAVHHRYTLTVRQSCPPTPGQADKLPFHIPLKVALIAPNGTPLPLRLQGESEAAGEERVLEIRRAEEVFCFEGITEAPVPSLLRGFSAPVKLELSQSDTELAFLMAHDNDEFNRWDASQQLALTVMLRLLEVLHNEGQPYLDSGLADAFGHTLANAALDPALVAEALNLPAEEYVGEFCHEVDPGGIHVVRQYLRRELAQRHRPLLLARYQALTDEGPYRIDATAMGRRRLRNLCLSYLLELEEEEVQTLALAQFEGAHNMTDALAALTALVHTGAPQQQAALEQFYQRWHSEALVLDKWFALQASSPLPGALGRVEALLHHADFNLRNPNRVRSLVGTFAMRNTARFHEADGSGYAFLTERVMELDTLNPQIAARMITPLTQWRRYDAGRRDKMREQLERILGKSPLSPDVYEVVSKSLA